MNKDWLILEKNRDGDTILFMTVMDDHIDVFKFLLNKDAEVSIR